MSAVPASAASAPLNAAQHVRAGQHFVERGLFAEAEIAFRNGIELNPGLQCARRGLATLLVRLGRREESFHLCYEEVTASPEGLAWLQGLASNAMRERDLTLAGEYAAILASLRRGTQWYPRWTNPSPLLPVRPPNTFLTIPKLQHDVEQFLYLQRRGVLGSEFTAIIESYERVIERLTADGIQGRAPLEGPERDAIGHVYNRIVHVRPTPRVARALSVQWDAKAVESEYLDKPPGIVVIDNFLSSEALESLRHFCLESTVWSGNRYRYGRLGTFFRDGFNCPLLLQIAEELREALPRVITARYPLTQLWGFKYAPTLPANSTHHADFAAVNVNFWITPEDANLDKTTGGLVIYDVDAPMSWDFDTYNGRRDIILPYLRGQAARPRTIPYRQNRVVIFNSDLFHETAAVQFRPDYESRRVNVTMLYGYREDDVEHRQSGRMDSSDDGRAAWRSAAFSRSRGRR